MSDFFHGWRRKAGCVALVMACGLVGLWIRGHIVGDFICIRYGAKGESHNLSQDRDGIYWIWEENCPDQSGWYQFPVTGENRDFGIWQFEWRWQWCGFDFAELNSPGDGGPGRWSRWGISHWNLIIPLSLLSAYLILRKPRASK